MKILKSIWAVVAGFITVFALSVLTDMILEGIGFFPPQNKPEAYLPWMLLIALIYRMIYSVLGFYITGRLAPNKPMRLVLILGVIGTIFAALGAIVNWKLGNNWYPVLLVILTLPSAWVGGKLALSKRK
ncbi:MAG TPA: hypothetical protein VF810_04880 [Patescibacteria group bacterium]